jgi:hypothetical protein
MRNSMPNLHDKVMDVEHELSLQTYYSLLYSTPYGSST